jgi:nucleotide-binding universal stress UspA family protein
MAIHTILIPNDGSDGVRSSLELGLKVARDFEAHAVVLHVRPDPRDFVPIMVEGASASMIEQIIGVAAEEVGQRAAVAHKLFDDCCREVEIAVDPQGTVGASAAWMEKTGRENDAIAAAGRLADLIVVCRPDLEQQVSSGMVLNAALFETGHPVLLAPPGGAATFGRRVVIAWNASPQAARAVTAALPVLSGAGDVAVIAVKADHDLDDGTDNLVAYLSWHGIEAVNHPLAPGGLSVGAALLAECGKLGADCLVMGAYTHSRMRQLILGGVTSHVLDNAEIPLFMAH